MGPRCPPKGQKSMPKADSKGGVLRRMQRALFHQLTGLGECCKLSQQRPGQSPDRKRILGTEESREPEASFRRLGIYRPPRIYDFIFFRVNCIFEMALHCYKNNTLYVDRDPHGPPVIYWNDAIAENSCNFEGAKKYCRPGIFYWGQCPPPFGSAPLEASEQLRRAWFWRRRRGRA